MNMRISIIFDCNQNQCVLLKNAMRHFTLLCSWLTLMSIWARADSIIICRCMERYNTSLLNTQQRWTISIFFPIWIYLTNVIGFITSVSPLEKCTLSWNRNRPFIGIYQFWVIYLQIRYSKHQIDLRLNRNEIYTKNLYKALEKQRSRGQYLNISDKLDISYNIMSIFCSIFCLMPHNREKFAGPRSLFMAVLCYICTQIYVLHSFYIFEGINMK